MAVRNAFFAPATGINRMAERAYVFTLWLCVAGGLAVASFMATWSYDSGGLGLGPWVLLGLVVPIGGIFVGQATKNPAVTMLGYLMVVAPLGYVIGPMVAMFQYKSVVEVMYVTGAVTVGMWMVGTALPAITRNLSGYICGGILLLILGNVMAMFFPGATAFRAVDWLGAALFTCLIVYDSNKAMQLDYTVDNAIKASIGLYLDIVNLFLYLLDLFGNRNN